MGIPIETVKTDAFEMEYFKFGRGSKNLVILPGLSVQSVMGLADAVAEAYQELTEEFTIYLFDRRKQLPPEYTVREMGLDTAEAIRQTGLHDICLFGTSQGGMIALTIAIEHPELVHKLVVGSSSAHLAEEQYETIEEWVRLAKEGDAEGLYLAFGQRIYPPAVFEQCREMLASAAKTVTKEELEHFVILAEGMRGFDITEGLAGIQCPVLAIGDFEDAVVDADATMEIAEKLEKKPDFRLFMYIGYGHAAYDLAPDYKKRILDFLR